MNRNTIISLSMLYALWQSKRQDVLDLITPFVIYAVGVTTKKGDVIDIEKVCNCMVEEFGYRSFQPEIVNRILTRSSAANSKGKSSLEKRNGHFYLKSSLDNTISEFSERRTKCKSKSDSVTLSLSKYLNENNACGRSNYTQEEAERYLLVFFEANGNSVISAVDDLHQIMSRDNEIEYFIANYILEQNEKKSKYMDYLVELVKGYYVTTAIYLQAENPNITTASFKEVTFYLDTAVLLALLGYKSKQENESVQEMVKSLRKSGAKISCFDYNIDEVESILNAYRMSKIQGTKKTSTVTLEYFDEMQYPSSHVEAEMRLFKSSLQNLYGIISVDPSVLLASNNIDRRIDGLLDDDEIRTYVKKINPNYNVSTLPDDIKAINAVSRLRGGKELKYIEKCKAVFVTKNTVLVSATKKYLEDNHIYPGFPIAISDGDLCIIAWLKDFESNNNLPQMRLLENVLAVITPTQEMMDIYFSHVDELEKRGEISEDEATLLRIEQYTRTELMNLTRGNLKAINEDMIFAIRERMRAKSFEEGVEKGKREAEADAIKRKNSQRNAVCIKAENEISPKFEKIDSVGCTIIKIVAVCIALFFIFASVKQFLQSNYKINISLLTVAIITTAQGAWPFFTDNFWAIKLFRKWLSKKKRECIDKRKEEYLSVIE